MASIPALYTWTGSEWVLALPVWIDQRTWRMRVYKYSANGTTWVP